MKQFFGLVKKPLFDKILIANRGEIACRVMRTAKKLGVRTVAVYSDIDRDSMHVNMADEAYCIGPPPSSESYLLMDRIIDVAKRSGAQAIHPGYGFLSENPDFADKVSKNGITFIGPPASAIIAMGSKSASKTIMQKANVPVVPGYHGDNQDPAHLKQQAAKIGYPVLIKAIKGGGGKGMRIVEKPDDFEMMLESSKREAKKSFGDDRVLVEKYLVTPRHVEVQVFCDTHGNAVYLFERDCSVQRRHQKVIEEAPAPHLSEEIRRELGEKAVAAAKAVNYVGAGTVEFIMDNETNQFYFMEMNTRLQVEHPVTEMVTGTDLVEWQLEVASGNNLPQQQNELVLNGHCFETRIYAENPRKYVILNTGKLIHLRAPTPSSICRVETGVREGDQVSVFYDPMIAKLVVWGPDRPTALKRLSLALSDYQIVGPETNIEFLKALAVHPEFALGHVETGFIKKYGDDLLPPLDKPAPSTTALAALGLIVHEQNQKKTASIGADDALSPWTHIPNYRLNLNYSRNIKFSNSDGSDGEFGVRCEYKSSDDTYTFEFEDGTKLEGVKVDSLTNEDSKVTYQAYLGDQRFESTLVVDGENLHLFSNNTYTSFVLPELKGLSEVSGVGSGQDVKAPMPSKIAQVLVKPGQKVKQGEPVVILEAMKMEHVMRASKDAVVENVRFALGDLVNEGQTLVSFEKEAEDGKDK